MRLVINDILSEEDKDAMIIAESDLSVPFFDLQNIEESRIHCLSEIDISLNVCRGSYGTNA